MSKRKHEDNIEKTEHVESTHYKKYTIEQLLNAVKCKFILQELPFRK
jgi:hypothetical protein